MVNILNTKIDWCDSTWNPATGCLHGCEYCYARNIAKRFGGWTDSDGDAYHDTFFKDDSAIHVLDKPLQVMRGEQEGKWEKAPYPYDFQPTFHRYRLNDYVGKQGRNFFVCSMADLFGEWVPDSWIEEVFKACEKAPQHNYLFLTKNPERYVDLAYSETGLPIRENMWYGSSVTDSRMPFYWGEGVNTFLSIEPILEPFGEMGNIIQESLPKWIIVGAETGRRKNKVVPERKWIEDIARECEKTSVPLFMKSSLADIWGKPLIQEFPEELRRKNGVE